MALDSIKQASEASKEATKKISCKVIKLEISEIKMKGMVFKKLTLVHLRNNKILLNLNQ